ncbi:CMGC/RCK/MAK protein kinase [Coprinopsis cinerea okayama7|uniref:CMGC/RCK/MAK protein kinase n=1 Tax=Coprinopsis cinerea (strain Okayama-7 / 130 / ATCC MYA-4618 / FGSC 9003) TaxID=240176 RepID=A8N1F9_COPC7|nr:CMGC/RCK/MAK protein kinase [Coprinopsis cinerea okayama7\|eukprot:XP_001828708.2 CMGC/RCK/MAK protein kinase [Coprinopsis cinerea okayama7\
MYNNTNANPTRNRQPPLRETITVVGIPSVSIDNDRLVVGSSQTSSTRSYTPIKVLGDGSFGTVWLCDWHTTLPPNTPLSPMQCGQGARPEWAGKRLVAVKRMKKRWEGGWDECQKLKELESLRAIPFHPNIIPLYDFFLLPTSKELYFVFESMEGNLYHLIKARKGRPLAGGLVSSIFQQITLGLDHIHTHGYFHRDMKPENVLVTTVGLFDYTPVSPIAPPNAPKERDVVTIIKLADFGLARETRSRPPYTEYVSTRWYRAPEVLLLSREYSNPVDLWALGTIMAELVNLRPLFPGSDQVDQVARVCEVLGDPAEDYRDNGGNVVGGGQWPHGVSLARDVGFQFPRIEPKDIFSLFDASVPRSLIQCIRDLLRWDPAKRLTSKQCLDHLYLRETIHRNNIPMPSGLRAASVSQTSIPMMSSHLNGSSSHPSLSSHTPRNVPPSHSNSAHHVRPPPVPSHFPEVPPPQNSQPTPLPSVPHQPIPLHAQNGRRPHPIVGWTGPSPQPASDYPMDTSPSEPYANGHANNGHSEHHPPAGHSMPPPKSLKLGPFGKKSSRWALGIFGSEKSHQLPPVDEVTTTALGTRKRSQSSSTDGKSVRDLSPERPQDLREVQKQQKKEAERINREAEKERRKLAEKMAREQARAVMSKRNRMLREAVGEDIDWSGGNQERVVDKGTKQASSGPIRQKSMGNLGNSTLHAASGKYSEPPAPPVSFDRYRDWRGTGERVAKARRREYDDDHSMSSSDVHSLSRVSSISFATVDSDPGPSRLRHHSSFHHAASSRTSRSSLRTSFDDFSPSARSSNSFSLEGSSSLAHEFGAHLNVNPHISGSVSPPPLHMLSLSPTLSPPLSPNPPWIQVQDIKENGLGGQSPPYITLQNRQFSPSPHSPLDIHNYLQQPPSPFNNPSAPAQPPTTGQTPRSANSAINPIFKVVSLDPDVMLFYRCLTYSTALTSPSTTFITAPCRPTSEFYIPD